MDILWTVQILFLILIAIIFKRLKLIKMKASEGLIVLQNTVLELNKIKTEVQALKDKANNPDADLSTEWVDAINGISTGTKEVDDLNEDAAPVVEG